MSSMPIHVSKIDLHEYMTLIGWRRKDDGVGISEIVYSGMLFGQYKESRIAHYGGDLISIKELSETFNTSQHGFALRVMAIHATSFDLAEAGLAASRAEEFRRHAALEKLGG